MKKIVSILSVLSVAILLIILGRIDLFEEEHWLVLTKNDVKKLIYKAEMNNNGEACYCLTRYYLKNEDQYEYWLQKAIVNDNARAQLAMYLKLTMRTPKNTEEAIDYLRKSADQNNYTVAQNELGSLYQEGRILNRDWRQAEHWFRRGIDNGNTFSMYYLSCLLTENRRDLKGLTEAYKWLEIAKSRTSQDSTLISRIVTQKNNIINKALKFNYDKKYLIRNAETMAVSDGKQIIYEKPRLDDDERCRRLASEK